MVADILCEFLEVAIHLILYVREVYPSGIFQKRKKYNVPVQVEIYTKYIPILLLGFTTLMSIDGHFCCLFFQMSCHPELNQYIQDTLHCIKPLIEKVRHDCICWGESRTCVPALFNEIFHFSLRTMQRRWLWSSWTKSIIQWRDLCLRFPNLPFCLSGISLLIL